MLVSPPAEIGGTDRLLAKRPDDHGGRTMTIKEHKARPVIEPIRRPDAQTACSPSAPGKSYGSKHPHATSSAS